MRLFHLSLSPSFIPTHVHTLPTSLRVCMCLALNLTHFPIFFFHFGSAPHLYELLALFIILLFPASRWIYAAVAPFLSFYREIFPCFRILYFWGWSVQWNVATERKDVCRIRRRRLHETKGDFKSSYHSDRLGLFINAVIFKCFILIFYIILQNYIEISVCKSS